MSYLWPFPHHQTTVCKKVVTPASCKDGRDCRQGRDTEAKGSTYLYSYDDETIVYKEWKHTKGAPGQGKISTLVKIHRDKVFRVSDFVPTTMNALFEWLNG